ncbi:hypothetical protein T07_8544, partial [Trichinella nelsoni]
LQTLVKTSFYCFYAFQPVSPHRSQDFLLLHLGFYTCFPSQKSERTNEYERFIGLQTLVNTSFYCFYAFQPVSPHRIQVMALLYERTNEYERFIGLQTVVTTSFYCFYAFQPVSPLRSQVMVLLYERNHEYERLIGLQTLVKTSLYCIYAFQPVSPHRSQIARTDMSGLSVCKLLSALPSTTFRLLYLFRLTEVRALLRICAVDRFAYSYQDFLLLHLFFYTCFASQKSGVPSSTIRDFYLYLRTEVSVTTNISYWSLCSVLSGVPPTNFASFCLCISALMSRFYTCFALQKSERSNGYERLISFQTPFRSSFYLYFAFQPVSLYRSQSVTTNISYCSLCSVLSGVPPTIFAAFYLCFSALMSGCGSFRTNVYVRLIILQTLVRTSFNCIKDFITVSPHRIQAFIPVSPHISQVCKHLSGILSTTFRVFNLFRLTEVRASNGYERLIGLPSTTFRLFNLFRLTEVRASNGYERLIGLQTRVRSSCYQFCIFLPVYICTEDILLLHLGFYTRFASQMSGLPSTTFRLFNLFRLTVVRASNGYERLIGLKTPVRKRHHEYKLLVTLLSLVRSSSYNFCGFLPVFLCNNVRAHQRICAVDRFANSYQEFLLQQLGISPCFSPQKSDITSNIRFGSPCKLLSGVPPTNFASFYLCIYALKSGKGSSRFIGLQTLVRISFYYIYAFIPVLPHRSQVMVLLYGLLLSGLPSTTFRPLYLFRLTEFRVPSTNFASSYLCISALISERTNEYVRLIEFRASNGYERLIVLQTLVRSSFHQFCKFLPVYICTEVRLFNLFRLTEVRASNGYERLIGLKTPVSCSFLNYWVFLPVSPHRSLVMVVLFERHHEYKLLVTLLSLASSSSYHFCGFFLCISALMSERTYEYVRLIGLQTLAFIPVSPHIIQVIASNGYERLIGLQTLVRSSFYQFCIFLPVYICTEAFIPVSPHRKSTNEYVWLIGLQTLVRTSFYNVQTFQPRTNEYERLIGLQTPVRTSFYNVQAFQPVSPHRNQRTNVYVRLIILQILVRTYFNCIKAFITVSPHRIQRPMDMSAVIPTNFASFYLCISALMSERTYEYVRLIGLQTLVRSSFYQFCIFLPVYICTEVRLFNLFCRTEVRASNGYERLIGLQTPVKSSFFHY